MEFEPSKFSPKLIYLFVTIFFVAINLLGLRDHVASLSNSLFTPIMFISSEFGNGIKSSYQAVGSINTITSQRNDLLIENAKLKADNSLVQLLKDRVELLEKEINLAPKDIDIAEVSVINGGEDNLSDLLIVNGGDDLGISKGDIAKIGNIYIGTIESVNARSSRVVLPTYAKSFLRVVIIPSAHDISSLSIDELDGIVQRGSTTIWSGVASGNTNGIEIENIEKNADIKIGDHVLVNDSDIGGIYYLGDLSKITVDPTEVQITASVSLPINYRNISNLMILKQVE